MCEIRFKIRLTSVLFFSALMLGAPGARAEVKLPSLVSDGLVLQQGMKVNIWGTADPGEPVTVTLGDQRASTTTDNAGQWKVKLGPLSAGGPFTMTIAGKNAITLHDVLVGEVWVCSGQSNMEMPVGGNPQGWSSGVMNSQDEIARADHPMLHLFTVERAVAGKPQQDVRGYWVTARSQTVSDFSAVGYFFGRELLEALNVPIGMIHSSWGGTPAEAWTSRGTLESDPGYQSILEAGAKLLSPYPKDFADYALLKRRLLTSGQETKDN